MKDTPALSIRGLKFRYPDATRSTVDIAQLDLARGEQMLLTGGSGRGKSTLLHLIAGLIDPQEGTVGVAGTEISTLRGARRDLLRGSKIGMIFQTFNLLHGFSARENVMAALMFSSIPAPEHSTRAERLLKHLGIDRVDADPDRLSVGQQQRVAVARAVACDPVLVLADEPTASLDPENGEKAVELIQSACREKNAALLCVSHDPSLRARFSRRASLEELCAPMTDWTIILRSLTSRLFSTVTTVVTVAVAVGLMLVLLMMRDSGRKAFERGSGNMHLLVSADASPLVSILNGIYYANPPRRPLTWAKYGEIAGKFPLEFAIPTQIGDSYEGMPVLATTPDFFTKFEPVAGRPWGFREGRGIEGQWDLVLGSKAAAETGLKLGSKVVLTHGSGGSREGGGEGVHVHNEFKFTVVGLLEPTGSAHDRALFTHVEASWIMHAFDRIEREHATTGVGEDHAHHDEPPLTLADVTEDDKKITGIYLRLISREGSDSPANLPQIFDMLRRDPTITVAQPDQEIERLFAIVGSVDQVIVAIAAVVMVSSGIAIMLALYNSMEQRRRQIAVLRVLGCSRPRIFGLVLTESTVLGLAGAAAGLFVSLLGAQIVAQAMKQRLGLVIDAALPYYPTLAVVAAATALAALAGVVPAVMAYRTPVAKNLKPIG